MKVKHGNHDYLEQLKYPLEKYLCVLEYNYVLNVASFTFTMRSIFTFLTFQKIKKLKLSILEIL